MIFQHCLSDEVCYSVCDRRNWPVKREDVVWFEVTHFCTLVFFLVWKETEPMETFTNSLTDWCENTLMQKSFGLYYLIKKWRQQCFHSHHNSPVWQEQRECALELHPQPIQYRRFTVCSTFTQCWTSFKTAYAVPLSSLPSTQVNPV